MDPDDKPDVSQLNSLTQIPLIAEVISQSESNESKPALLPDSDSALSVSQESSIRLYVESLDGSVTDDDFIELSARDKVNRGTLTEREEPKSSKCKYCVLRLSKLRRLEKLTFKKIENTLESVLPQASPKQSTVSKKERGCQTSASLFEKAEMTQRELRSLAMILRFRNGKPLRTETYCKCVHQRRERECRCGEEESYFDWVWDQNANNCGQATTLQEQGRQVIFHKDYSCGTSGVRGQQAMERDQYFWEIKMTTPVYGTDMMVGVGTENVDLNGFHNMFCSLLGLDMESWGISYDGRIQHNGLKSEYCSKFGQGAIIGAHLDMWHGTLAFFKNRQCLGVAFRNLRGRILYPMACSTAARSGMRIISSRSFPTSLQFFCCQNLRKFVPSHLSVLDALAMPPGLRAFLANNMTWLLDVPHPAAHLPKPGYVCQICMPLKSVFEGCTDDEDDSSDDDRINHIQDILNFGESDEESDNDEIDKVGLLSSGYRNMTGSLLTPRRNHWLRPVISNSASSGRSPATQNSIHPQGQTSSGPSTSEIDRSTVMRRTLCGAKKFKLDDAQLSESEQHSSDGENAISEEGETTQVHVNIPEEEDMESEDSAPTRKRRLGKRKHNE